MLHSTYNGYLLKAMSQESSNIFFIHKCCQYWWRNGGGDNLIANNSHTGYMMIHASFWPFHWCYTPNQWPVLKEYLYYQCCWKMGPRKSIFIEILNGLFWWSNRLKMRNWWAIPTLPHHSVTWLGYQIEGIHLLILSFKAKMQKIQYLSEYQASNIGCDFLI